MKIFLKIPQLGEVFTHDSPLYKIIKLGLPAFILISSITVFAGVRIHADEFLTGKPWLIVAPGYSFAYLIFSLAPDLLNAVLVAYVVRSLLNKRFHYTDIILNVCSLALVVFLSSYSYKMSKFSAIEIADEVGQEEEAIDLSTINATYRAEVTEIETSYNNEVNRINQSYGELITAMESSAAKEVKPLRDQISTYERNRKKSNTQWTDTKINKLNIQISNIDKRAADDKANLLKEKQSKIDKQMAVKNGRINDLDSQKQTDRQTTTSLKEKSNKEAIMANEYLKGQLSRIAGFAVFIVLVLAIVKEIIHFRNGIEPAPVLSNLDFQTDWIKEVLFLPFVTVQRKLINAVRTRYENLPELKEPPQVFDVVDYMGIQKVLPVAKLEMLTDGKEDGFFFRKKSDVPFIAHKKSTSEAEAKQEKKDMKASCERGKCSSKKIENEEEWKMLQRLKMYKKRVGEHQQKAKLQEKKDGYVKPRTKAAIANNKKHVQYLQEQLKNFK